MQNVQKKVYTAPAPRLTRSKMTSDTKLKSALRTGAEREIRKAKKEREPKKSAKKGKQPKKTAKGDGEVIEGYDSSLFEDKEPVHPDLGAKLRYRDGPAAVAHDDLYGNRISPFESRFPRRQPLDGAAALKLRSAIFEQRENSALEE